MTLRARAREAAEWLLWAAVGLAFAVVDRATQRPVRSDAAQRSDWHAQAERERVAEGSEWP